MRGGQLTGAAAGKFQNVLEAGALKVGSHGPSQGFLLACL